MHRTILLLAALVLPLHAEPPTDPQVFRKVLRKQGDDGVHTYRIPGLATSKEGTLLAVFDLRHKNGGDLPGDIDVGLMRSTDSGETWGPVQRVLDFDAAEKDSQGNGVGDPAILVDQQTGAIFVAGLWSWGNHAWNASKPGIEPGETGQLVVTKSTDDGQSWSSPVNLTRTTKDPAWRLFFQGPGSGIQLKDGTLVFPAQFRAADGPPHSCFIFSTDHGESWHTSAPAIPGTPPTSESAIAQLEDGSLLLSMRNEAHSGQRVWARYDWTGTPATGKWSEPWLTVPDPTCMASLIRHPHGELIFSNPNSAKSRVALTLRTSTDGGRTWSDGRLLDPRPSAYSCLTVLKDGRIGILYETGDKGAAETLTFARVPLSWISGK